MDAVQRFAELVTGRGRGPDLDVGALAIAAGSDPGLDPEPSLRELDRLAEGVDSLEGLVQRLFVDNGFTGNSDDYYDPRNSLLPEVLRRRAGIPITLSLVAIEVGRRAGIALEGVGMPGYFLFRPIGTEHYLDAFDGGRALTYEECEQRFRSSTGAGDDVPFTGRMLATSPTRAILARVLENLRVAYRNHVQPEDVEWVLRMRLLLPGVGVEHLLEMGNVLGQQGRWDEGAKFLVEQSDGWPQHAEVLDHAARVLLANLN
ncbi:MAG: hypothetical protein H0W01_13165 [Pseudonocardiales bacterium]|nr:hypothetical protein [Pseudonocardiales bacterium]